MKSADMIDRTYYANLSEHRAKWSVHMSFMADVSMTGRGATEEEAVADLIRRSEWDYALAVKTYKRAIVKEEGK